MRKTASYKVTVRTRPWSVDPGDEISEWRRLDFMMLDVRR
jgi:hypothetical protein